MVDQLTIIFEQIALSEKAKRKGNGHDKTVGELQARPVNPAAVALVDRFRGESSILFGILGGTLPAESFQQEWLGSAFSVGPHLGIEWTEWGLDVIFSAWLAFVSKTGFKPESQTQLELDAPVIDEWYDWDKEPNGKELVNAFQIGAYAGGDGLWVLENGEVWFQSVEPDDMPFIKMLDNIEEAIIKVGDAISKGELVNNANGTWRWGELVFCEGDPTWSMNELLNST